MSELSIENHLDAAKDALRRQTWSVVRVQGAWRKLQIRRDQDLARTRRIRIYGAPALVLAAALALLLGAWTARRPGDRSATAVPPLPAGFERRIVSEGIEADVEASVGLEVKERTDARVVIAVGSGKALFRVRHDPKRLFRVQTGEVTIDDLGTTFEVVREGDRVRVSVSEGAVSVAFPNGSGVGRGTAVLKAPGSGSYPAARVADHSASRTLESATTTKLPVTSSQGPAPVRGATGGPNWRELARGGKHGSAYDLLAPSGFRDVKDEPGDLLLASDAARLSHHPKEAVTLLRKLLARHADDPRAPAAAFQLGWLLMKDLGRPRDAATAFARAEALAPRGNLAEDALARAVEAWHRAGDTGRARAEVERYRASYPRGRHLAMLERLVGTP
jgi:transmembrane sensor